MAYPNVPNPLDALRRVQPRQGPNVQNGGGLQANTSSLAQRPPGTPGQLAAPGPPPLTPPPQGSQEPLQPVPAPAPAAPPIAGLAPGGLTPAPAPGQANTPTPAAAQPAPAAAPDLYGAAGGTSATPGSLEDQLRSYISNTMGGVTSQGYINRAKNQLSTATEGGRAQAANQITDDAIRRGMFRGGDTGARMDAASRTAQGAFATGLGNILQGAEQQDIAARQGAAGELSNLLGMNRAQDQYAQQRADAMRGGGGSPSTFTYIDPDTGESYDIPMDAMGGVF